MDDQSMTSTPMAETPTPAPTPTPTPAKNKSGAKLFLMGLLGALVVLIVIMYAVAYSGVRKLSTSPMVLKAAAAFHMPAAKINSSKILYTEYIDDINALQKFYSTNPDQLPPEEQAGPKDEQISNQALIHLVTNQLIFDLADEFDAEVSEEEIQAEKEKIFEQFGGEDKANENAQNLYGWSVDTFVDKIIYPILLEGSLEKKFYENLDDVEDKYKEKQVNASHILFKLEEGDNEEKVKANAQAVLDRINGGENFEELAQEFGTDGTKDYGGLLGWFGKGEMVPPFEEAAFALEAGQLGELVQTQFGFHILKVNDVRNGDFIGFTQGKLQDAKVKVYLPITNPFEQAEQEEDDDDGEE